MSSVTLEKYVYAEKGALRGLNGSILETLIKVHAQAVALSPSDLGQLRNSLMVKTNETEKGFNSADDTPAPSEHKLSVKPKNGEGFVGTNSDHWYPEFGTRLQVAQPFLRPAGELAKGSSVKSVVSKYCQKAMLEEFAKRKVVRTTK